MYKYELVFEIIRLASIKAAYKVIGIDLRGLFHVFLLQFGCTRLKYFIPY